LCSDSQDRAALLLELVLLLQGNSPACCQRSQIRSQLAKEDRIWSPSISRKWWHQRDKGSLVGLEVRRNIGESTSMGRHADQSPLGSGDVGFIHSGHIVHLAVSSKYRTRAEPVGVMVLGPVNQFVDIREIEFPPGNGSNLPQYTGAHGISCMSSMAGHTSGS